MSKTRDLPVSKEVCQVSAKSRRQRAEANPDKILDSAMELMAEHGYAGTTISMIKARSGYPVTSIYWHFGNKERLLLAALERSAMQSVDNDIDMKNRMIDGNSTLESQAQNDADFFANPPPFVRLIFLIGLEKNNSSPEITRTIVRIRQHTRQILAERILKIIRPAGEKLPEEFAQQLADLWMAFGDGLYISSQLEPGTIDIQMRCRQQIMAMQFLAENYMKERSSDRI